MDAKAKVVAFQYLYMHRAGARWITCEESEYNLALASPHEYETRQLIPLTDHEAALAELRAELSAVVLDRDQTIALHETLRSGLEALAGEWDEKARSLRDLEWHAVASAYEKTSYALRTLASSATGEKNTEEETGA